MTDFFNTTGPMATPVGSIYDYASTPGQVISSTFEETILTNPTSALYRWGKRSAYELGLGTRITAEAARQQIDAAKVDVEVADDGITQEELDMLLEAKQAEVERQQIYARSAGGFSLMAGQFATGLVGSVFDPLNIAGGGLAIKGASKLAQVAHAGRAAQVMAKVRAARGIRAGAAEGAIGAAVVEPAILLALDDEQLDYGALDSLLNVGFGTVLGGISGGILRGLDARNARTVRDTELAAGVHQLTREEADQLMTAGLGQLADDINPNIDVVRDAIKLDRLHRKAQTAIVMPSEVDGITQAASRAVAEAEIKALDAEAADIMTRSIDDSFEALPDDFVMGEARLQNPDLARNVDNLDLTIEGLEDAIDRLITDGVDDPRLIELDTKIKQADRKTKKKLKKQRAELLERFDVASTKDKARLVELRRQLDATRYERARLGPTVKKAVEKARPDAEAKSRHELVVDRMDEIARRRMELEERLRNADAETQAIDGLEGFDARPDVMKLKQDAQAEATRAADWRSKTFVTPEAVDRADQLAQDLVDAKDTDLDAELAELEVTAEAEMVDDPILQEFISRADPEDELLDSSIEEVNAGATAYSVCARS